MNQFLDLKRKVVEPAHATPVPRPMQIGFVLDHVTFHYPTGARKVLEDVSLTIRPGEVVALVGEKGSGKTTLVKLLCRLYDPTGGTITLDGVNLRRFETAALRREFSVLFQDYAQYHLTARENFVLQDGRIIEEGTHDELIRSGGTYAHLFETQARQYR